MAFMAARIQLDDEFKFWFRGLKEKYLGLGLSWEHEDDLHLTLKFFAGLNTAETQHLSKKLESYSFNHEPFSIKSTVVRSFENPKEHILWLAVEESEPLNRLQKRIDVIFEAVGIMPSRFDFVPHITLARARQIPKQSEVFSEGLSKDLEVKVLHLMKRRHKDDISSEKPKFFDVSTYEL